MRRSRAVAICWTLALALAGAAGCAGRSLLDNSLFRQPDPGPPCGNPLFLPLGPADYALVFEKTLDVLDDIFEIEYANRYSNSVSIRTHPKIAPGLEQPWKPGSPDGAERLLATLQSMRYRAEVTIQPAEQVGFFVQVIVYKELEDLARPIRATAGAAAFRSDNSVDRQFEVVDPSVIEANWIPKGREENLEQAILQRIRHKINECACRQ
jgi:hypothetical protein